MKVFETVEMLATPFFDYVQILKGLHHCLRLQPREQQGTGEYRKEVNDRERERERERVQAGEGCWVRPWLNPHLFSCVLQINKTK